MRVIRKLALAIALCGGLCAAEDLSTLDGQWRDTLDALKTGNAAAARAAFARFTATAESYVSVNGRNWKIEYLLGSLDCRFPDSKQIGAEFLNDILQNNRTLNDAGIAELRRQVAECSKPGSAETSSISPAAPPDLTEASTHYQTPGISERNMKSGGSLRVDQEFSAAVSPIPASELASRLVAADQPETALQNALKRLSPNAHGATVGSFAVASVNGTPTDARKIGLCLEKYAALLNAEFQIASSNFMVTAYAVPTEKDVYTYARKLHGLQLPNGVIAYSISDDMSLVSSESGDQCGSMAHELVHLLIKNRFPGAPAWLEEGLASEVAIAEPSPNGLRFGWSWRDQVLSRDASERPGVAELLEMPWSALVANKYGDMRRVEATQAMAAVFVRYLYAKGKLPAIYFAVRDQHVSANLSGFMSYRSILEAKLQMPVEAIDRDFDGWFKAQARSHMEAAPGLTPSKGGRGTGAVDGPMINAPPQAANGCGNCGSPTNDANPAPNQEGPAPSQAKPKN